MVLDIPGGLFGQQDVRETPASTSSSTSSTSILAPVGSIMAWLKSFTNTPQALPDGWMEADGSAISDADSVYNGQNAPDLNGNEFVKGAATSGGTGGGTTGAGSSHTHVQSGTVSSDSHGHNDTFGTANESSHTHLLSTQGNVATSASNYRLNSTSTDVGSAHNHTVTGSVSNDSHSHGDTFSNDSESSHTHTSAPKYYNVVWIFRFK